MDKQKACRILLGLIKVDGLEPHQKDFWEMVEKEKRGEITDQDILKYRSKSQKEEGKSNNACTGYTHK